MILFLYKLSNAFVANTNIRFFYICRKNSETNMYNLSMFCCIFNRVTLAVILRKLSCVLQLSNLGAEMKSILNPYLSKHIGRRTGKDIKAGKNIRVNKDGYENFDDYFSESDAESLLSFSTSIVSGSRVSSILPYFPYASFKLTRMLFAENLRRILFLVIRYFRV